MTKHRDKGPRTGDFLPGSHDSKSSRERHLEERPIVFSMLLRRVSTAWMCLGLTLGMASHASAQSAPSPSAPLRLTFLWDSAPHTTSTARNFQSLFDLYGHGVNSLFGAHIKDPGKHGIVLRLAKAPLDAYVAWLVTLGGHEFGHCQQAWLGGSEDCHWVPAQGPYALGHIITVGDAIKLTAQERQAVTTGGTEASVAGAASLKREVMTSAATPWTSWPLLAMRQLDQALYGLTSPSPSEAESLDYANDMTNYARFYGLRSGRSPESVFDDVVHGAWWNLADPFTWYGIYSYVDDYAIHASETTPTPGIGFAGRTWMATTNAWLSEVGVRYQITGYSRGFSGDLFEVTSGWGEGQPAVAGRWSRDVPNRWRVRLGGDFWRQRAAAAAGPLDNGGAIAGGLSKPIGRVVVIGDLGYKTTGVMLGQPHGNGWFWSVGSSITIGR